MSGLSIAQVADRVKGMSVQAALHFISQQGYQARSHVGVLTNDYSHTRINVVEDHGVVVSTFIG